MRVLGVDPGSRLTGYGCIEQKGNRVQLVTHGTIRLISSGKVSENSFEDRLVALFQKLSAVIEEYRPDVMAVEKVFFSNNASSAFKLGQARGVILLAGKMNSLRIFEYSATEVKRAVVGYGQADKRQVATILQLLMGPQAFATPDASDGLALALCHAQLSPQQNLRNLR